MSSDRDRQFSDEIGQQDAASPIVEIDDAVRAETEQKESQTSAETERENLQLLVDNCISA